MASLTDPTAGSFPASSDPRTRAIDGAGFFAALFDFSFASFVTLRILKVIYVLLLAVSSIAALGLIVTGFGAGMGILALILAPLLWLVGAVFARVYVELIAVLFRIGENTTVMARATRDERA